ESKCRGAGPECRPITREPSTPRRRMFYSTAELWQSSASSTRNPGLHRTGCRTLGLRPQRCEKKHRSPLQPIPQPFEQRRRLVGDECAEFLLHFAVVVEADGDA